MVPCSLEKMNLTKNATANYFSENVILSLKKKCVTVPFLLCFILYFRAICKYKPPGAYIRRGDLKEDFLSYDFFFLGGGGRAYIWRGLFSEFYHIPKIVKDHFID